MIRKAALCILACGLGLSCQTTGLNSQTKANQSACSTALKAEAIKAVMEDVADWQIYHPFTSSQTFWRAGALYAGMSAWAKIADADKYYSWLVGTGAYNSWHLARGDYHADSQCVGQMYIEMYEKYRDPVMIRHVVERFDEVLAHPSQAALEYKSPGAKDRWCWCDALFMAPPVWAKLAGATGERKYLDFMDKEWWATIDYLYDKEERLVFRDSSHFERREANGKKVFWGRGNGWVIGGLVRVLEVMPADYPSRARYEEFYKEYAARLASLQQPDGLWHSSLLDPVAYPQPEASASGFICYGIAWGVHHGLLDRATYLPVVEKAWAGLVGCVRSDGMLGWVQPVGGSPQQVSPDTTEIYGVGAFLLAGSEVYALAMDIHG